MGMYDKDGLGMFHGRLLLLAGLMLLGTAVLGAQLVRLTAVEGAQLRAEAERRLVRLSWEPTTRGRILDRTGRVLAQDRPAFDVRVDYDVLSGEWAGVWSAFFARRAHAEAWPELGRTQRSELAEAYEPFFADHAERGLAVLADHAGVPLEEIYERRKEALDRVGVIRRNFVSNRLRELRRAATARGRELSQEHERRLERQADRPVREERRPHTVIPAVGDDAGFDVLDLAERTAVLEVPLVSDAPADFGEPTAGFARVEVPAVPGLVVGNSRAREYPFDRVTVDLDRSTLPGPLHDESAMSVTVDGVTSHLVGWVREGVYQEDPAVRRAWLGANPAERARAETDRGTDRGQYMEGDRVGHTGIEAAMEHRLRGLRGLRVRQLDTGDERLIPREPGRDATLTIDAVLQARIAAAMSPEVGLAVAQPWHADSKFRRDTGEPLSGAAVVLDVRTGEVLAMVSTPTMPIADARGGIQIDDDAIGVSDPRINRAVSAIYPPGSIAKAMVLAWAGSRGEHALHERIPCTGHFLENRQDILRCWIYRPDAFQTHTGVLGEDPDEAQALMVSCNIYFNTLGARLGVDRVFECYRAFGVGRRPIQLPDAVPGNLGLVGPLAGTPLTNVDAALMGIGQGPVVWSPMHAANAYATLARGGVRIEPTIVRGADGRRDDIGLEPEVVRQALRGLWLSTNDYRGTGYHVSIDGIYNRYFNAPGVTIWGKTGTAQAPATLLKSVPGQEDPQPVTEKYTHAWFVGLVGEGEDPEAAEPRYAIAVLMEFAGSGGRVSAPVANQIIHALQAEGYLGGATRTAQLGRDG
ncbi:MAG: penicillin-binding transpeptidase domain-containing protein [Planctomycetota bacterium]